MMVQDRVNEKIGAIKGQGVEEDTTPELRPDENDKTLGKFPSTSGESYALKVINKSVLRL